MSDSTREADELGTDIRQRKAGRFTRNRPGPSGSFGGRVFREGFAWIRALEPEQGAILLDEDEDFGKAAAVVGGFEFETPINAVEEKSAEGEGSVSAGIDDVFKAILAAEPVFDGGANEGEADEGGKFLGAGSFVGGENEGDKGV